MRKSDVGDQSVWYSWWIVVATLIVLGGTSTAVFAAGSVARQDAEQSLRDFERNSAEVASTLELAIQHHEDLIVNAGAFYLGNTDATTSEFDVWTSSVQATQRYPEVQAIGYAVLVPAAELPAYAARVQADPKISLGPTGSLVVIPAGARASLCLAPIASNWNPDFALPAGTDLCASPLGPVFREARDTGVSAYSSYQSGSESWLAIEIPLYRGGVVPTSVEARRAAFVAWVALAVDPRVVLDRAIRSQPHTAVSLRRVPGEAPAEFSSGTAPAGARSVTTDLKNGWEVQLSGKVASDALLENGNALVLLIAGFALSLLLGALVFALGTGRARAVRLVRERTAELRGAQSQLVDAARSAGRAEIAINVLHNVGNVLNSVNVSANLVVQKVRGSKSNGLARAVALMREHAADLGDFLATDTRGKQLPDYLDKLATTLAVERETIEEELLRLTSGVDHIKEIVNAQQSLAGVSGVIEPVRMSEVMESALRMAGVLGDDEVTVIRDFPDDPLLELDRHRVMLVLLNLIGNAIHAMKRNVDRPRELSLRTEVTAGQGISIIVADNGEGIPQNDLTRVFVHGFTTHVNGHGFGLHSSALAAKEMGGSLTAFSDGTDTGASFTLEMPLETQAVVA